MIKVALLKNAVSLSRYFAEETAAMRWGGHVALALGLHGEPVTPKGLLTAAWGHSPRDGQPLYQRAAARRRLGWDLVFAPDKTISVAALVGAYGDPILRAHTQAVETAFTRLAQPAAAVRTRTPTGSPRWQLTGAMLYTHALHRTNREKEPHLHSHLLVMNVTRGAFQGPAHAWMALQTGLVFERLPALESAYHQELWRHLRREGFPAERSPSGKTVLPALQTQAVHRTFAQAHARVVRQAVPVAEQIQRARAQEGLPPLHPATLVPLARQIANDRHRPPKEAGIERKQTRFGWRLLLDPATRDLIDRGSRPSKRVRRQARRAATDQSVTPVAHAAPTPVPASGQPVLPPTRSAPAVHGVAPSPALAPTPRRRSLPRIQAHSRRNAGLALGGLRYLETGEPTPKVQPASPALAQALRERLSPTARRVRQTVVLDRAMAAPGLHPPLPPAAAVQAALKHHFHTHRNSPHAHRP